MEKRGSQRVDVLRSIKWKLDRNTLEIIYKSFNRPIFEYASVVWHNAPRLEKYSTQLEQLQSIIDAARILIGTIRNYFIVKRVGKHCLTDEKNKDLYCFIRFINGLAPRHLANTLHPHTQHTHGHYTRQQDNISHILARTDTYKN